MSGADESDLVLIYKDGCGYYRHEAKGYAYLEAAGLFTRHRAEAEARAESTIRIVEPADVVSQAKAERKLLLDRVEGLDRIIALAESAR